MNPNYTDITLILDRSGSMASIASTIVKSLNEFIEEQRKVSGKCLITLAQFDLDNERMQLDYLRRAESIWDVNLINEKEYKPRGGTPLLDAMGTVIEDTGKRLAAMPESERPKHVICGVFTDGEENSSRTYTAAKIKDIVRTQTDTYKWEFVFIGAEKESILAATRDYGFDPGKVMYSAAGAAGPTGNQGAQGSIKSYSANVRAMRVGAKMSMAFEPDQQAEQDELLKQGGK